MPDTEVFLTAIQNIGDKVDAGLERVHSRIDDVAEKQDQHSNATAVFAERLANHIAREDIHMPLKSCGKCDGVEDKIDDHVAKHGVIVKQDLSGIIGKVVLGALLTALAVVIVAALSGVIG